MTTITLAPVSTERPRRSRRRTENLTGWLLVAPCAALIALFFLLPFGLTIYMSFFDWPTFGAAEPIGADNYSEILGHERFWAAVRFTVLYTVVASSLGILISLGLALLVRPHFRGRTVVRALLFAPVTIGFVPAGLLWLSMSNSRTGILPWAANWLGIAPDGVDWFAQPGTTLAVVVIMTVWKTAGFAMLVLLVGMDSIPSEIYEAARLDGSGAFSTLTRITLPLIVKPLSLVILLTVTSTFLAFDQFFTMTKGGPDRSTVTVVYYLYNAAFVGFERGYAAAVAVLIVLLMAAFSIVQVRLQRTRGN